jgi:hypothetical protein
MGIEVGMRVKCIKKMTFAEVGSIGKVIDILPQVDDMLQYTVEWDNYVDGHTGNQDCKQGYGEFVNYSNITESPTYIFSGLKFIESEGYDEYLEHKKWVDGCDGVAIINGFALAEDGIKYSVSTKSWQKEVK